MITCTLAAIFHKTCAGSAQYLSVLSEIFGDCLVVLVLCIGNTCKAQWTFVFIHLSIFCCKNCEVGLDLAQRCFIIMLVTKKRTGAKIFCSSWIGFWDILEYVALGYGKSQMEWVREDYFPKTPRIGSPGNGNSAFGASLAERFVDFCLEFHFFFFFCSYFLKTSLLSCFLI